MYKKAAKDVEGVYEKEGKAARRLKRKELKEGHPKGSVQRG